MNENSNNSLTKTFELNIIEDQENNLKDLKEYSGLSYLKGNYIPPSDNLSYFSGSGLINKFKIGKRKEKRKRSFNRETSSDSGINYLQILRRRSFHMNNVQGRKKFVNYKEMYKDSFTYSDSEENLKNKSYEYPTNFFNQIFFAWTIKLFRLAQKNGQEP